MSLYIGNQLITPLILSSAGVQLNAPIIVKNTTNFTLQNPDTNGSYPTGYKIFIDEELYKTVSKNFTAGEIVTIKYVDDMSKFIGEHTLKVTLFGNGFLESNYSNEIKFNIFTINQQLTNITSNNQAQYIYENDSYTNTLTPVENYYLPSKISVLMDNIELVLTNYNDYTGVISIPAVTGNISIKASGDTLNRLRTPWLTLDKKELTIRTVRNADYYYLYMNDNPNPVFTYEVPPFTYTVEQVSDVETQQFALNSSNYYESKCQKVNNGWSLCKIVFSGAGSCTLHCISNGESSYDYGIIGNINETLASSNTDDGATGTTKVKKNFKGQSSTSIVDVVFDEVNDGDFIMCKYRKDSSGETGLDSLQFQVELG